MTEPSLPVRSGLDIIDELRSSARVDSTGEFTIDPTRALEKMRHFATQDPYQYVLWLVATAVAGGAKWVKVLAGVQRTCVEFDGQPLSVDEMGAIFSDEVRHLPGRSGHLSTAVCTALSLHPKELVVESALTRVTITDSGTKLEHLKSPASGPAVRFCLVFAGVGTLLSKLVNSGQPLPERALLEQRIHSPNLKLTVNDHSWSAPWGHRWSVVAARRLMQPPPEKALELPTETRFAHCDDQLSPGPFSAVLALHQFDVKSGSTVHFVRDGVSYTVHRDNPVAYLALVNCPALKLDLSRANLVEDELYQTTLFQLDRQAEELARTFLARFEQLMPWRKDHVNYILQRLLEVGSQIPDPVMVEQSRRLLAIHCRDGLWESGISAGGFVQKMLDSIKRRTRPPTSQETEAWSGLWNAFLNLFRTKPATRRSSAAPKLEGLVAKVISHFDPNSGLRVGISRTPIDEPGWLTIDGVRPDGTRLLLQAEEQTLRITLTCPVSSQWPADLSMPCPPSWTCHIESQENRLQASFTSNQKSWRDLSQLDALLTALLYTIKEVRAQQNLACPGCAQPMEKVILDLVLDRCTSCHGAWFDYAELEWLLAGPGTQDFESLGPGCCPHCQTPLQERYRGKGSVQECPTCNGAWVGVKLDSPANLDGP